MDRPHYLTKQRLQNNLWAKGLRGGELVLHSLTTYSNRNRTRRLIIKRVQKVQQEFTNRHLTDGNDSTKWG